jgi:signal transduction histidine kinase
MRTVARMSSRLAGWVRRAGPEWVLVPVLLGLWALLAGAAMGQLLATLVGTVPMVAALVVAPRWPAVGLVAPFAALLVPGALSVSLPEDPFLGMLVYACFVFGRCASMTAQPWAGAGVLVLLSLNLVEPDRDLSAADAVFPVLLTAGPWLLGLSVQLARRREHEALRHAEGVEARREDDVRRAAAEERLRVARDLHDVVAHNISALSLQAQVCRRRLEAGGALVVADVRRIEETAQAAMTDVRRLLGVLRIPEDDAALAPAAGIGDLDRLVAQCRESGQPVDLTVCGEPRAVSAALSQAAYRIVQEALTNARRHGSGGCAVELSWAGDRLRIEIANPVDGRVGDTEATGHGLLGMRERAAMFGGAVEVGVRDESRWLVKAELPFTPAGAGAPA